jgi:predicted extracellular nuclease
MQSSCSNSVAPCSNLFISEYIEGASNDKCIEIYNPTGAAIDLAAGNYVINRYSNGGTTPAPISLTGTIASGDVFVICNPNANATLLALADDTSGGLSFNGDDALELVANGTTIDVFGQIGVDPGAGWTGACGGTQNMTLRRMMSIQSGDGNGADTFDPCVEYNAFPDNDFTGFGGHISTCIPCNISITSATPTATSCDGTSDGMIVITATTDNGEFKYFHGISC